VSIGFDICFPCWKLANGLQLHLLRGYSDRYLQQNLFGVLNRLRAWETRSSILGMAKNFSSP